MPPAGMQLVVPVLQQMVLLARHADPARDPLDRGHHLQAHTHNSCLDHLDPCADREVGGSDRPVSVRRPVFVPVPYRGEDVEFS